MRDYIRVPAQADHYKGRQWLLIVRCPFCPKTHTHGGGNSKAPECFGSRVPHCCDTLDRWGRAVYLGEFKSQLPDYDIRSANEDVDWEAEYLRGNRLVLAAIEAAELPSDKKAILVRSAERTLIAGLAYVRQLSE